MLLARYDVRYNAVFNPRLGVCGSPEVQFVGTMPGIPSIHHAGTIGTMKWLESNLYCPWRDSSWTACGEIILHYLLDAELLDDGLQKQKAFIICSIVKIYQQAGTQRRIFP